MRNWNCVFASVLFACLKRPTVAISPKQIFPLGFIIHPEAKSVLEAFKFAVNQHNQNADSLFKVEPRIAILDTDDTLSVGRVDQDVICQTKDELQYKPIEDKTVCEQMKHGVVAIMGVTQAGIYPTLRSYVESYNLPYINLNYMINQTMLIKEPTTTARSRNFHLNLRPFHGTAIADLISHYAWSDLIYLYDSEEGTFLMQYLLREFARQKRQVHVQRIFSAQEGHEYLKSLDILLQTAKKHIVLDLSIENTEKLITLNLEDKKLSKRQIHYVMANLGTEELSPSTVAEVRLTGFTLLNQDDERFKQIDQARMQSVSDVGYPIPGRPFTNEQALILDGVQFWIAAVNRLQLKGSSEPDLNTLRQGPLNTTNNGSSCSRCSAEIREHGETMMNELKKTEFIGLTGEHSFGSDGNRHNYTLYLLDRSFNQKALAGVWNENDGLQSSQSLFHKTSSKRDAPTQRPTRTGTALVEEPFLMLKAPHTNGTQRLGNDRFEGYCADLIQKLAELANFTYEIKLTEDSLYGVMDDQGNWNGMIGELVRKEVDLSVAPLTITSKRERVVDFTKPFMSAGIDVMVKKPLKIKPGVFSFLAPFSADIWVCIICAFFAVTIVLFIVCRLSPYEWSLQETSDGPMVVNKFSFCNTLGFIFGGLMQQGTPIYPSSVSSRLVAGVWGLFVLVIIALYIANLAAFMGARQTPSPGAFLSLEDMLKQKDIEFGLVGGSSVARFFRRSEVSFHKRMWETMSHRPHLIVKTTEEGVAKVRSSGGRYAFFAPSPVIEYYSGRLPCDIKLLGENLSPSSYGIATQSGSLLTERLSQAILSLQEDGSLTVLQQQWWISKDQCLTRDDTADHSGEVQLSHIAGIFYILILGLGIALLFVVLEFFYKAKKDSKKNSVSMTQAMRNQARLSIHGKARRDPKELRHRNVDTQATNAEMERTLLQG